MKTSVLIFIILIISINTYAYEVDFVGCEYILISPIKPKYISSWAGGKQTTMAKIKFDKGLPLIRVECMVAPVSQEKLTDENIFSLMKEQADTVGLDNLQMFIEREQIGIIGKYTGTKNVSGIVMMQIGSMYFGDHSILNVIGFDQLKNFPSEELNSVFFSVRKR